MFQNKHKKRHTIKDPKIYLLFFIIGYFSVLTFSERVGKILYAGYPEQFNDSVMHVPRDIIALSEHVYVGMPETLSTIIDSPSIFFVIDHSGSMYRHTYDSATNTITWAKDPMGNRFKVTKALIDTLNNPEKYPGIEIGFAVFASQLYYDPKKDTFAVHYPDKWPQEGGYIKLLRLDKEYLGQKGGEILKERLHTTIRKASLKTPDTSFTYEYVDLTSPKVFGFWTGTNINVGFDAAKHSMTSSTFKRENHFFIFFSDGEATEALPGENKDKYIEGTDVATTFTIFFTDDGAAPQNLEQMNTNVQNNGYSKSNPKSTLWPYKNTTLDELMEFLMKHVVTIFQQHKKVIPKKIEVSGVNGDVIWDGKKFILPGIIPLTGETTSLSYSITYTMCFDTIDIHGDTAHVEVDTTISTSYEVVIDEQMIEPVDSFKVTYWDREIDVYEDNKKIEMIDEHTGTIKLRFSYDPGDAHYNYTNIQVEVTNKDGAEKDTEVFTLEREGSSNVFSAMVKREPNPAEFKPGDGVFQHYEEDKLTATFRNSEKTRLPLDTLRIEVPIGIHGYVRLDNAVYFDNNADGFIDSIYLDMIGDSKKIESNKDKIVDNCLLPEYRHFTVDESFVVNGDIGLRVTEDNDLPRTSVTDDDVVRITDSVSLANNSFMLLPATVSIKDSVAPVIVKAHFLDSIIIIKKGSMSNDSVTDKGRDELTIRFSEDIKEVYYEKPFTFFNPKEEKEYTVTLERLKQEGTEALFEVKKIENAETISEGDSIRIDAALEYNIVDLLENEQDNEKNVRKPITVETITHTIFIRKPFTFQFQATILDPDKNVKLDDKIIALPQIKEALKNVKSAGDNTYKGIMVMTLTPDKVENVWEEDWFEATITIIDHVGNKVLANKKMVFQTEQKRLVYIWDGFSDAGRMVGSGSYGISISAVCHLIGKKEQKESISAIVGVKK